MTERTELVNCTHIPQKCFLSVLSYQSDTPLVSFPDTEVKKKKNIFYSSLTLSEWQERHSGINSGVEWHIQRQTIHINLSIQVSLRECHAAHGWRPAHRQETRNILQIIPLPEPRSTAYVHFEPSHRVDAVAAIQVRQPRTKPNCGDTESFQTNWERTITETK